MSHPVIYSWPVPSATAVAQEQTLAGAGSLVLNGSFASGGVVVFPSFARTISLISANDLNGVQFTVTGTANGAIVSETIAGPNNDRVETTVIFNAVTSITTNNAAAAVSAGTGTKGRTAWFLHNYHAVVPYLAVQVNVIATINYSFVTTLINVEGIPDANIISFNPIADLTNATADKMDGYFIPARYSSITVNSSNDTGALTAIFLQQGIL
jgi:hypothetical protein